MRLVWYVARIRHSEILKQRDHLGDLAVHGTIILKWILEKQCITTWTGSN